MFGIIDNSKMERIKTLGNECREAVLIEKIHPEELTVCGETTRWEEHYLWVAFREKRPSGDWVETCQTEVSHYMEGDEKEQEYAFASAECEMRDFVEYGV